MRRYSEFKERFPRANDSIFYFSIMLIGMISMIFITNYSEHIKLSYESKMKELMPLEELPLQEEGININVDRLLEYRGVSLSDIDKIEDLIDELPIGEFVKEVVIGNDAGIYGAYIEYDISSYASEINDTRVEQKILINSVVLMSLCKDINSINFELVTDKSIEQRLFYRVDIEDYLGEKIIVNNKYSEDRFRANIEHFLQIDNVSKYFEGVTTYKSEVSNEIDVFYKSNFPIEGQILEEKMPYMPEDLGTNLVKEYGCTLFVEGLKYENDYIKYYSIYRLIEFYGSENLEEIIVELAICKNNTLNEDIKSACEYVSNILTDSVYNKDMWIPRYMENNAGGGTKLYRLHDNQLKLWGVFEQPTKIEDIITSPDNKNVWIVGQSQGNKFVFILPILGEEIVYIQSNQAVVGQNIYPEIILLASKELKLDDVNARALISQVTGEWYFGSYMHINIYNKEGRNRLFYNPQSKTIKLNNNQLNNMELEQMLYTLSKDMSIGIEEAELLESETEIIKACIGQNYITIYQKDKHSEIIRTLKDSYKKVVDTGITKVPGIYENNKIAVSYIGDNEVIKNKLEELF